MTQQQIIPAGGGQDYDWSNDHLYVKAPPDLTADRVTVVEDILKPGFHLPRHHHRTMTEIFYVLEGTVVFKFDDETIETGSGMTINIPPNTWHEVTSPGGAKLLTIFSPGGFEGYLAELAALAQKQFADEALMMALAEKYDTWTRGISH